MLEINAGSFLISCQLMKHGFDTTALEPIGAVFSNFSELQKGVLSFAYKLGITPEIVSAPAERFSRENAFYFAFSINVMEYVKSVSMILRIECILQKLQTLSSGIAHRLQMVQKGRV